MFLNRISWCSFTAGTNLTIFKQAFTGHKEDPDIATIGIIKCLNKLNSF